MAKKTKKKSKKKTTAKKVSAVEVIDKVEEKASKALSPSDPLARYLSEVRKYPLLTREEEKKLAIKYYETGDPEAAEMLVTSNLRFVVKIAAEYSKFGSKMIDVVQEGNVGLMHAVKEFNPYKDVRLITYAVWWIRGYIQEFLMRQYSMVRIGTTQNQRKLFYQLQKQKKELEKLGLEAGIKQLSGKLDISEREVTEMSQRMNHRDVSLDQPVGESDGTTLIDLQQDEYEARVDDVIEHQEDITLLLNNIEDIKPQLNEKELYLLENRLLADKAMTLQEIGDHYGVTREAIRQVEARLLKKIKKQMIDEE